MIRLPDGYCLTRALSQVKTVMLPRSCQRYRFVPPSLPLTHFLLHEFLHGEERVYMYTAHASLFQEHDTFTVPPVSMTMGHTKHGFPSVHELDQKSITRSETLGEPASQDKTTRRTTKKSKSLFSQQFESHSAEYFGIEMQAPQINFPMQRDRVEPIRLTGRIVKVPGLSENRQDASSNRGRSDTKDPLPRLVALRHLLLALRAWLLPTAEGATGTLKCLRSILHQQLHKRGKGTAMSVVSPLSLSLFLALYLWTRPL